MLRDHEGPSLQQFNDGALVPGRVGLNLSPPTFGIADLHELVPTEGPAIDGQCEDCRFERETRWAVSCEMRHRKRGRWVKGLAGHRECHAVLNDGGGTPVIQPLTVNPFACFIGTGLPVDDFTPVVEADPRGCAGDDDPLLKRLPFTGAYRRVLYPLVPDMSFFDEAAMVILAGDKVAVNDPKCCAMVPKESRIARPAFARGPGGAI